MVAGVAGGSWMLAPGPQGVGFKPVEETWDMPKSQPIVLDSKVIDAIASRNLWGEVQAAKPDEPPDIHWRFVGIGGSEKERAVLIQYLNKPVQILKVGDILPGGAKIMKIGEDRLCLLINGKRRALEIYRR